MSYLILVVHGQSFMDIIKHGIIYQQFVIYYEANCHVVIIAELNMDFHPLDVHCQEQMGCTLC